jgi:hypothetical protein
MSTDERGVCLWCAYLGRTTSRELSEMERGALWLQRSTQPADPADVAGRARDLTCLYGLLGPRVVASDGDLLRAVMADLDCPEWRRHHDGQSPGTAFRTEQERQSTDLMEEMLAWTRRRPRLAATVGIAGLGLTGLLLWLTLWQ